jgi:hypothetical protein
MKLNMLAALVALLALATRTQADNYAYKAGVMTNQVKLTTD